MQGKLGFYYFLIYLCCMKEVEELLTWSIATRQSFDGVINKMEEKIDLDEDDLVFLNKMYLAFDDGDI